MEGKQRRHNMGTDPRLENYLLRLEKALGAFSTSERAEIITEIKSHVLSALERDPDTPLDSVLMALGEPETVANRYLMERGLKLSKPPISPIVKWIVIGFLGTLAMLLIFSGFVIYKLSPVIKVDESQGYVSLLGGAIQVSGDEGEIKIGGSPVSRGKALSVSGAWWVPDEVSKFELLFANGKVEFKNSKNREIQWVCKGFPISEQLQPTVSENGAVLNLTSSVGVKCTVKVPKNLSLRVTGANGKVEFDEPQYNVEAHLHTGKVVIEPHRDSEYQYSLKVDNGKVDSFQSSSSSEAHKIQVYLGTGKISRD